jgi:hypothetical protein
MRSWRQPFADERRDVVVHPVKATDHFADNSAALNDVGLWEHECPKTLADTSGWIAIGVQNDEDAVLVTQLAEANGETYGPARDFPSTGAAGEFVLLSARNRAPHCPRQPPRRCESPLRTGSVTSNWVFLCDSASFASEIFPSLKPRQILEN